MASQPITAELGVAVGQVLSSKYRVDAIIGRGGMGIVCACTNLQLGKKVAIKMLRPDVLTDLDAVRRFEREAHAAAELESEFVAKVTDSGVLEGNKVPYMVMEYLDGHDLAQHLDDNGSIPVPWATEIALQVAEALAEAHTHGIVHRDVKPTNLFLTWRADGSAVVKVLDFGISKARTHVDMQLTQTQSVLGTPAYMSPEQMRSAKDVDARTDIWSLGSVLYEIIEGHRPFEAESFSEMCVKVSMDPPLPMHRAPAALQQVILRCLAKQPDDRYRDMGDLARDLVPFTRNALQATALVERMQRVIRRSLPEMPAVAYESRPPVMPAGSQPEVPRYVPAFPHARDSVVDTFATPRRRKWPMVAGILAATSIAVVAVAIALSRGGAEADPVVPAKAVTKVSPPAPPDPPPPPPVKTDDVKQPETPTTDVAKRDEVEEPVDKGSAAKDGSAKKPPAIGRTPGTRHPPAVKDDVKTVLKDDAAVVPPPVKAKCDIYDGKPHNGPDDPCRQQ